MNSPHSTNFKELAENEKGVCPYCGKLNEPFKHNRRDGRFICRECGLSFELDITEAWQKDLDVKFLRDYPKAVVEDAKWVDSVLLTGVTIAGAATVTKVIGVSEISLYNLKISLQNIWGVPGRRFASDFSKIPSRFLVCQAKHLCRPRCLGPSFGWLTPMVIGEPLPVTSAGRYGRAGVLLAKNATPTPAGA